MLTYGLDAQTAFQVLRGYSQVTNVKVREVATDLVASMARGEFPAGNAAVWETVVAAQVSTTAEPKEQAGSRGADDPDPIL
jgi:hypothetical protein